MQPSEGYVRTDDGLRVFFQRVGDGPTPVIIPNRIFMIDHFSRFARGRTLVFIDPRNRAQSDVGRNDPVYARGVHQDVDDIEAVRRRFGFERVTVLGHSYCAITAVLYALRYPERAERIVQLGAPPPVWGKDYPAELKFVDATYGKVMAALQQLAQQPAAPPSIEQCRQFLTALRPLYVVSPADADKLAWDPCVHENERNFMQTWNESIVPSLQALKLSPVELASIRAPVLTIHGRKDRSAPYGGGQEWVRVLPNARLLTVEGGGHCPWIEEPDRAFAAIEAFLDGRWPDAAVEVESVDGDALSPRSS